MVTEYGVNSNKALSPTDSSAVKPIDQIQVLLFGALLALELGWCQLPHDHVVLCSSKVTPN